MLTCLPCCAVLCRAMPRAAAADVPLCLLACLLAYAMLQTLACYHDTARWHIMPALLACPCQRHLPMPCYKLTHYARVLAMLCCAVPCHAACCSSGRPIMLACFACLLMLCYRHLHAIMILQAGTLCLLCSLAHARDTYQCHATGWIIMFACLPCHAVLCRVMPRAAAAAVPLCLLALLACLLMLCFGGQGNSAFGQGGRNGLFWVCFRETAANEAGSSIPDLFLWMQQAPAFTKDTRDRGRAPSGRAE